MHGVQKRSEFTQENDVFERNISDKNYKVIKNRFDLCLGGVAKIRTRSNQFF